jgi:uncharacterized protein
MKKWLAWLVLGLCLAVGVSAWAQPKIPPAPSSNIYVQDYAGVLSGDTKARINSISGNLASKTKAQVVVVTIKTLEDMPIEEYGLTLMRQWGIGDRNLNNGVLLLVAVGDRQSRIEIGYGLEGALPDAKTGRIQDEYMIPYFQKGDYDKGILNGYSAVVNEVAKEYKLDLKTDAKPDRNTHSAGSQSGWDSLPWWVQLAIAGGILLLFIFDWVFLGGNITLLILSLLRFRGGGGGGGGFGGGSGGGGGSSRRW